MKRVFIVLTAVLMVCAISISALAVTTSSTTAQKSWSSTTFTPGKPFTPPSGYTQATFYNTNGSGTNYIATRVYFTLSAANVSAIAQFKAGTHPLRNGMNLYFGSEMVGVPDSGSERLDATAISSSLPDPHFDLEDDFIWDGKHEESEVVALGTVTAKQYYQSTQWDDLRNGSHGGKWTVNFHESGQYLGAGTVWVYTGGGDYNTVEYEGIPSAFIQTYGATNGQP
ncbi:hypothetical protein FACS18949_06210 [Clostridia bacterium]|nr:hypothetical protein FACS18949_06210 [Clostridia bacterium]